MRWAMRSAESKRVALALATFLQRSRHDRLRELRNEVPAAEAAGSCARGDPDVRHYSRRTDDTSECVEWLRASMLRTNRRARPRRLAARLGSALGK